MYNLEHCTDKQHSFRLLNSTSSMGRFGADNYDLRFQLLKTANAISQVENLLRNEKTFCSSNSHMADMNWTTRNVIPFALQNYLPDTAISTLVETCIK